MCNPRFWFAVFAGFSIFSLSAAFIAQYVFDLAPCNLCIIQRYPFAIIMILGIIGFFLSQAKYQAAFFGLIGVSFAGNGMVAFYHTGVEQKWWKSALEGCNVPDLGDSAEDIIARIEAQTEVVRCDEIPWQDPILGLSMANYNAMAGFVFAGLAFFVMYRVLKRSA